MITKVYKKVSGNKRDWLATFLCTDVTLHSPYGLDAIHPGCKKQFYDWADEILNELNKTPKKEVKNSDEIFNPS